MNDELLQFTKEALTKNIPRPEIQEILAKAGWRATDIEVALNSFADLSFALPVPRPKPYLSAREVFIYVVMFSSLYVSCYNVGSLIFDIINKAFPDPSQNYYNYHGAYYQDSVRWAVANLSVAFPLFFITFRSISRRIAENPDARNSRPRKWMTYITLMLATLFLTCDFGVLVYNVLGGELTARFFLKVLTVALIAGSTFLYFLFDMREEEKG